MDPYAKFGDGDAAANGRRVAPSDAPDGGDDKWHTAHDVKPSPPFSNNDLTSSRREYIMKPPSLIDRWILSQLRDSRDAPMAYLLFNICTIAVPAAIGMFMVPATHLMGLGYLIINAGLFMQRFILCLHYVEHLQPFVNTPTGWILAKLCPYVLSALYGIPPGIYRLHHVVMHHCENNLFPYDVSSTEPYQRDNFLHFLCYWARFWIAGAFELPYYAYRRGRFDLMTKSIMSLLLFVTLTTKLYHISSVATIWVVIIPFFLASFALMFGNWSQHIFIDPSQPRSNYSLTYNLVNAADNSKTFNDGYHIIHHSNSKLHWTELPKRFMETLDKHAEEDALIFQGIGFFDVGIFVFTRRLGSLAERYMNVGQKKRTKEELVALFKERLRPIKIAKQHSQ